MSVNDTLDIDRAAEEQVLADYARGKVLVPDAVKAIATITSAVYLIGAGKASSEETRKLLATAVDLILGVKDYLDGDYLSRTTAGEGS